MASFHKVYVAALGFALTCASGAGLAAPKGAVPSQNPAQTKPEQQANPEVRAFLQQLHVINAAEVKVGTLAESKGQSGSAKDFGRALAVDHAQNQTRVEQLARDENVSFSPTMLVAPAQALQTQMDQVFAKLQKTPPAKFDATFAQDMIKGHEQAIKMVKDAEASLKDSNALALARDTLPDLEKHLTMARQLAHSSHMAH